MERVKDGGVLDISAKGGPSYGWKKLPIEREFNNKKVNREVVKNAMRIMPTKEIEGFFVCKIKKHPHCFDSKCLESRQWRGRFFASLLVCGGGWLQTQTSSASEEP